jgi:hypothetical protein
MSCARSSEFSSAEVPLRREKTNSVRLAMGAIDYRRQFGNGGDDDARGESD